MPSTITGAPTRPRRRRRGTDALPAVPDSTAPDLMAALSTAGPPAVSTADSGPPAAIRTALAPTQDSAEDAPGRFLAGEDLTNPTPARRVGVYSCLVMVHHGTPTQFDGLDYIAAARYGLVDRDEDGHWRTTDSGLEILANQDLLH